MSYSDIPPQVSSVRDDDILHMEQLVSVKPLSNNYIDILIINIKRIGYKILKKITYEDNFKNALLGYFIGGIIVIIPNLFIKDTNINTNITKGSLYGALYLSNLRYISLW